MSKKTDYEIDLIKLEANSKCTFHPAKYFKNFKADNSKKCSTQI